MSERSCPACGGVFRKGKMALVFFANVEGADRRYATVCPKCVSRSLLIVSCTRPVKVVKKEVRSDDLDRCLRTLRTYRAVAQGHTANGRDQFWVGKVDGLNMAIETIERDSDG